MPLQVAVMSERLSASSRRATTPLYQSVETDLRARIQRGEYQPGATLPTEEALCRTYGVSRITVRRALDVLSQQGLIVRRRGAGSFVAEARKPGVRSVRLTGSLDEFLSTAGALDLDVRSYRPVMATTDVASELEVKKGESITWLEVISSLEDGPVIHLDIYFPQQVGDLIDPQEISVGEPIVRLVERKTGRRVVSARQVIRPALADARSAEALGIEPGTPVLRLRRIYYATDGTALEVAVLTLHPQRYDYEIEFRANGAQA